MTDYLALMEQHKMSCVWTVEGWRAYVMPPNDGDQGVPIIQGKGDTPAQAINACLSCMSLAPAIEHGTKAWADVPDNWLEELRGDDPAI